MGFWMCVGLKVSSAVVMYGIKFSVVPIHMERNLRF